MGEFKDLTGLTFGQLKVIKKSISKNKHHIYWECECSCGNKKIIAGYDLKRGRTTSCGKCIQTKRIGKKYNMLTILELTDKRVGHHPIYKCKCDCGNIVEISAHDLERDRIYSCGCTKMSKGEQKCWQLLQNNSINFITQFKYNDCKDILYLSFDIAVCDDKSNVKYLIEYDGKQHFKSIKFFGGEEAFEDRVKKDNIKTQYCIDHNIPLIRIPYTRYDELCIEDLRLETSKFIIKETYNKN